MQSGRSIISLSVPKVLEEEINLLASQENKTISELLREAFSNYKFIKKWTKIRSLGQLTAEKFKLESYDEIEEFAG